MEKKNSKVHHYARRKLILSGRNNEGILTVQIAENLRELLPIVEREAQDWKLVYSTNQHGISIKTLFTNCSKIKSTMMLVIRDTTGSVFGAFLSESPHLSKSYYGNGHCFLWKQKPSGQGVSIFYSTGRNEHFILSQPGASIAFGGGEQGFALWIDEEIAKGFSNKSVTFDNDILSTNPAFDIDSLELWSINF